MALTEAQKDELFDIICSHPIGTGYYQTSIGSHETHEIVAELVPLISQWIDTAREMAPEGCSAETGLDHCPIKNTRP